MKIFIGGAWPYANNSLHVGHLAALLPGDVIARYYRSKGEEVIYVSGTDCHGTPITKRAKKENIDPSVIADYYHSEFKKCFDALNFSYDLYSKTSSDFHKNKVQELFKQIYKKIEKQDYCPKCQEFLSDREIEGICPYCGGKAKGDQCDNCLRPLNANELLDKHCSHCSSNTVLKDNNHLVFALSRFQETINNLVLNNQDKWRLTAINETNKYLQSGLIDRDATRQLSWGVDTPIEGYEDKKIYVWIEAVLGYLTAGMQVAKENNIDFFEFMKKGSDLKTYYIHGKDNIPFHTVIFPSLLMALNGNIALPDYIISSEYVNFNDEKISKSKGNGKSLLELLDLYNSDSIRNYILANNPEKKDINFSCDELEKMHNALLVGEYGNFVNRNFAYLVKKFNGIVPIGKMDTKIKDIINKMYIIVGSEIEKGNMRSAINNVYDLVKIANKYYDDQKPWIQVRESIDDFNNTTYTCVNLIANIANMFEPFLPESSIKIKKMLSIDINKWEYINIPQSINLKDVEILFKRIEEKKVNTKTK